MRHLDPAHIAKRFPRIHSTCLEYKIDITKDLVPIRPAAHYLMGGVQTDLFGRTTIPGLFAAGETACTGVHGANRLSSNSLLEGVVYGARAAIAMQAQTFCPPTGRIPRDEVFPAITESHFRSIPCENSAISPHPAGLTPP